MSLIVIKTLHHDSTESPHRLNRYLVTGNLTKVRALHLRDKLSCQIFNRPNAILRAAKDNHTFTADQISRWEPYLKIDLLLLLGRDPGRDELNHTITAVG